MPVIGDVTYGRGEESNQNPAIWSYTDRDTIPESKDAATIFDLESGGCWDEATETFMEADGDNRIVELN